MRSTIFRYMRAIVGPLIVLGIFVGALLLLHRELNQHTPHEILENFAAIPLTQLASAVLLTALNYAVLIGYDYLGLRYLSRPLPFSKLAIGSLLGYAIGNSFGSLLGGTGVRYRLFTLWGFSAIEIVKLSLILIVTFWLGVLGLAGLAMILAPISVPARFHLPITDTSLIGYVFVAVACAYIALCGWMKRPLQIGRWELALPPLPLALAQFTVAAIDLMVAAGVLYVLLPSSYEGNYFHFLAVYLVGITAAVITHVPGGLGVFELIMLKLLKFPHSEALVGSLLAYRFIYYLLPLVLGLMGFGVHEAAAHWHSTKRNSIRCGSRSSSLHQVDSHSQ